MTAPHTESNDSLIPRSALTLPALRQVVAAVAPLRLPGFFEDMQKAFMRAEEEDDVVPVRMFYHQWAVVEIERHPP